MSTSSLTAGTIGRLAAVMQRSFTFRLFLYVSCTMVVTMIVFTPLFLYDQNMRERSQIMRNGRVLTDLLADEISLWVFSENTQMLHDPVMGIGNQANVRQVSVYTKEGKLLFSAGPGKGADAGKSTAALIPDSVRAGSPAFEEDADRFLFYSPVLLSAFGNLDDVLFDSSRKEVIGYVRVVMGKEGLRQASRDLFLKNLLMMSILAVVVIMVMNLLLRRVTRPLKSLTESVSLVGMGQDVRVPVESSDEIGTLARSFNIMTENLKKREQEKKLLEERLRHAEKMQAVGTLARGVAHDFNNILATVRGALFVIEKKLPPDMPLRRYTDQMHNSIGKATDLVESLLVFSRIHTVNPIPLDINDLIQQLEPTLAFIAGDAIEMKITLEKGALKVLGNPVQFEQVIINLCRNARDAMSEGGLISITTDTAEAGNGVSAPSKPGPYVRIRVADTGKGMDSETQARIFDPFFTTKEVGKGTGLGLSIVYGIVEEFGGTIEVKSAKDEGSVFTIILPKIGDALPEDRTPPVKVV